ncbi:MAG TPA: SAM-dependent methyltransferase [Kiritimatiellia bacterium]|nr:SAM-dependent methyltransferase [Kiritimatiellia bacterium]
MTSSTSSESHLELIAAALADTNTFIGLTLSHPKVAAATPWERVRVRPVKRRGSVGLQALCAGKAGTETRPIDDVAEVVDGLLPQFARASLQTKSGEWHIRVTGKGRVLMSKGGAPKTGANALEHDRQKKHVLSGDRPDELLKALEIQNSNGSVKPSMQAKLRQVNAFINLLEPLLAGDNTTTLRIFDAGCGSAYLTFALYHVLKHLRGRNVEVMGIDVREDVIRKAEALRDQLGWSDVQFAVGRIAEHKPAVPPDLVLSLHACDTATDEAIAQGVCWGSRGIVAVPCCQHELHHQLQAEVFRPITRHGILRERLSDLLTDAFRAQLLRVVGYHAEVIEFVEPEHTPKNIMIRAVRAGRGGEVAARKEYEALKNYWSVQPALEKLLGR